MKSPFYFLFCLSAFIHSSAQDLIDVSGVWNGTSSFVNATYQLRLELTQSGNQLEGYSITRSMNEKDSIKVRVNGFIKNEKITLNPVEIVYKTGLSCASVAILTINPSNQNKLAGKWKGDLSLKTCAPGSGGKIQVYKEKRPDIADQLVLAPVPTAVVDANDDISQALITELGKRKYYALIIGIEKYEDENIQPLDKPIDDGLALAQVLEDYYSFDQTDMTILKNATREDIIKALDELTKKVTEKDNLLIFYAGHGIWNEQLNQGYWLPSDASLDSKSYWLSNSTIRDYVGGIRSKHTLLISDACFSGGILKERAVFNNGRAILELYKLPSRKAMTSGTLKTVPDKSVFIEYLIKNLQTNTSPLLSADQLFRTFKIAVINNSPNGQVPQYGPITQAGDEGGDFIFLRSDE